jgi:hypothetical protein
MSDHNGTNSEDAMTTRKPKPISSGPIELPTKQLQLVTVTPDQKTRASGRRIHGSADLPTTSASPVRSKVTLH